ncbi:hypothetical protein H257_10248 [Aphanomyces astaci]|uniref:Fe2OG dioxygenase domain-containing protein n=1 Tax=Aphanomyces astaci TaxID=112090 RepID=W4G6R3_APHAT|nr:hypothetical protein H257_10248 [Aphanomyces astaci]ETV75397.1 hypothetical protein H257_10248 [Aphanomyces astaci]|eukprot:XP_009835031.1 hypothetical protein H257_10248 [Aphanomyces astaci]
MLGRVTAACRRWPRRSVAAMSSTSMEQLPFVEMSALMDPSSSKASRQPALDAMRTACRDFGFFTIPASVLPPGLLNKVYARADDFNALPLSTKQKYHVRNVSNARGWTPLHEEPSYEPGVVSHVEGFDLARDLPASYLHDDQGLGPNVWPAEVPQFRDHVMALYDATTDVSNALFEGFAEMLDLPRHTFRVYNTAEAQAFMRLLTYPPQQSHKSEGVVDHGTKHVGIAAHTDFECFTIIHQNNVGLQLQGRDGHWIDTPVASDRLFVLVGDVLEMWTNGELVATPHRVLSAHTKRQSIVRFNGTEGNAWIEPLAPFVTPDAPAKFQRVTQRQHIQSEMHAAEARLKDTQDKAAATIGRNSIA